MPIRETVTYVAGRYSANHLAELSKWSLSAGRKKRSASASSAISAQPKTAATQNAVGANTGDAPPFLLLSTITLRENSNSPHEINIIGIKTMIANSPRPLGPRSRAARTPETAPKQRTATVAVIVCAQAFLFENRAATLAMPATQFPFRVSRCSKEDTVISPPENGSANRIAERRFPGFPANHAAARPTSAKLRASVPATPRHLE